MNQDGKSRKDATYSVFFETSKSKTACTITLSQHNENEPNFVVMSPGNIVNPNLYNIKIPSLTCTVTLANIHNSSYSDYINAIALCALRAGFTEGIITAAEDDRGTLVYCSASDTVHFIETRAFDSENFIEELKMKCTENLKHVMNILTCHKA
ncbi:hypothetical protein PAEPH01_0616 [Pancytospora epiphaga]|nr:hypothetical protein PAEPH01_0616 [Pancytospora epiphaga]